MPTKYKYCPDCGDENIILARFCMGCRFKFPVIGETASTTPQISRPQTPSTITMSNSKPKPKIVKLEYEVNIGEDPDNLEMPDDLNDDTPSLASTLRQTKGNGGKKKKRNLSEEDEMLATSLVDFVASMCQGTHGGVKLGEALGSDPSLKKEKRAKDATLPESAEAILAKTRNRRNEEQE